MEAKEEDDDVDMEQPVAASTIEAGIAAGNIHPEPNEDQDDERIIQMMSSQAAAAQAKHEALLKSIEEKRLKQNLRVPTDDNEVKQRLRALKEPICFFGEDV